MKSVKRLALFALVLFAVAASTRAQQRPGYNPTTDCNLTALSATPGALSNCRALLSHPNQR